MLVCIWAWRGCLSGVPSFWSFKTILFESLWKHSPIFYLIHWVLLSFNSQMLLICHFFRHFRHCHGSHMHTFGCYFFNKVCYQSPARAKISNKIRPKRRGEGKDRRSISFIPSHPALALRTEPKYFDESLNPTEFSIFPAGFMPETRESALPPNPLQFYPLTGKEIRNQDRWQKYQHN